MVAGPFAVTSAAPYAATVDAGQGFTVCSPLLGMLPRHPQGMGECGEMVPFAAALFIGMFGWGATYLGWSDPEGKVQFALFTTFILGILCGYKSRG